MARHLVDTDIKIAQCPRCDSYVLKAQVSGYAIAADPTPLDVQGIREALVGGKQVHLVVHRGGRPWRLTTLTANMGRPVEGRTYVGDHNCSTRPMDVSQIPEVPVNPPRAPVSASEGSQGSAPTSPQGPRRDSDPATAVNQRPSRPPGDPGVHRGLQRPSVDARYDDLEHPWPTPTGLAARHGAGKPVHTAPPATAHSAPTEQPTSTASAASASTADAPSRKMSASSNATAYGATQAPTGPSAKRRRHIYRRCEECGELIGKAEIIGVEHNNRWLYIRHAECPPKENLKPRERIPREPAQCGSENQTKAPAP